MRHLLNTGFGAFAQGVPAKGGSLSQQTISIGTDRARSLQNVPDSRRGKPVTDHWSPVTKLWMK